MVCLGNICRSPLAEGIIRDKAEKSGLEVVADSAGTAAYHVGEPPDQRSMEVAKKHNIDISNQRARQFEVRDFDAFDRIYVMDKNNYEDVIALATSTEDAEKVDLILNAVNPGENRSVPDPYYGGKDGFDKVYSMLEESCSAIVENLKKETT